MPGSFWEALVERASKGRILTKEKIDRMFTTDANRRAWESIKSGEVKTVSFRWYSNKEGDGE